MRIIFIINKVFKLFTKITKKSGLLLAISVFAIACTTTATADTTVVKHASGSTEVTLNPKPTVAYDLAVIDTLNSLGVEVTGVPKGIWPDFLKKYEDDKKYPKVGTLFEPDYESVFALDPELIIVAGRSAPKQAELAKIAPTIDLTVVNGDLINSVKNNTNILATIYGKQQVAEQELAKIDLALKQINEHAAKVDNAMLILTVGGKISAYGPGSRFGIIHDAFGLKPAVKDLENTNHGQAVSLEFIYKNDPEWLFVIDRDAAIGTDSEAAQRLLDNELIHKTKAWKNKQIVYLNPVNWYILGSAGLNSLQQSIAEVDAAISK